MATEFFLKHFEGLGFKWIGPAHGEPPSSGWYEQTRCTGDVSHFARLAYKPRYEAFEIRIGFEHSESRRLLDRTADRVLTLLHPAAYELKVLSSPCWVTFNVGATLKWPFFLMPDPMKPNRWMEQVDELIDLLTTKVWCITDAPQVLRALDSDEPPFQWAMTQNILRAAEIIVVSKLLGVDRSETRDSLLHRSVEISVSLNGIKDATHAIDELFEIVNSNQ
jgi:hypothetical protein